MDAETFSDPRVREAIEKNFIPVKIDVDKDQQTANAYAVNGIPDVRVLDENGKTVEYVIGFVEPDKFLRFLNASRKE